LSFNAAVDIHPFLYYVASAKNNFSPVAQSLESRCCWINHNVWGSPLLREVRFRQAVLWQLIYGLFYTETS